MMTKLAMPLRAGVPQGVGAAVVLLIMVITATANGICIGTAPEYAGALSVISDDVTMGYYATSVGLCVILPVIRFINVRNTPKTLLLVGLIAEVLLALVCAKTDSVDVLIWASFFTGMAKGILLLTCIGLIRPLITPNNVDSEFMSWLMPFSMGVGQVSTFLTELFTYNYNWQYIYYVIVVLGLVAIVLVLVFFKYAHLAFHCPFREIDFKAIALITVALLGFVYFFSYGKTLDWFHSPRLVATGVFTLFIFTVFLVQTNYSSKPYIRSWQLLRWEGLVGYGFMVLVMFFNASSTVISDYMATVLKVDNLHINLFNLWIIPGYVVGGILCFLWYRYRCGFRWLVAFSMGCYVAYFAIVFFGVSPDARYESLEFSLFLRGIGMILLFTAFILYLIEDLKPQEKPSHLFYIICIRGALAPVLWGGVVSTTLYNWTQRGVDKLADGIRLDNVSAFSQYENAFHSALSGGHGNYESMQMATTTLYNVLHEQATLLAVKQFLGCFLIISIVAAVVSIFFPYKRIFKRDLVKRPAV